DVGAAHVSQQRVERARDHQLDSNGGGEVEAGVRGVHALVDEVGVEDAALDQLDPVGRQEVLHVVPVARAQVVEDLHVVASGGQGLDEMGADEASSAGDQISHAKRRPAAATACPRI